jgi:hypothetical protein
MSTTWVAVVSAMVSTLLTLGLTQFFLPSIGHASSQRELSAERFVLVDSNGRTRGSFGTRGGNATLVLTGPDGYPQASINVLANGSAGVMIEGPRNVRSSTALMDVRPEDGLANFSLFGPDGRMLWNALNLE